MGIEILFFLFRNEFKSFFITARLYCYIKSSLVNIRVSVIKNKAKPCYKVLFFAIVSYKEKGIRYALSHSLRKKRLFEMSIFHMEVYQLVVLDILN